MSAPQRKTAVYTATWTHKPGRGSLEEFVRALARRQRKKDDERVEVDWRKKPRKRVLTPPSK